MIPMIILAIEDDNSRDFLLRLYEKSKDRMKAEAMRYLDSDADAEDVVSEAVIKLVDKIDLLQQLAENRRVPYAVATARHLALRLLEIRKQLPSADYDDLEHIIPEPESNDPEEQLLQEQRNRRLRELLSAVPLEERLLLEKKYILLWSDSEIAEQLGIKVDSVRMRYTRAKRKLATALLSKGFSPEDLF